MGADDCRQWLPGKNANFSEDPLVDRYGERYQQWSEDAGAIPEWLKQERSARTCQCRPSGLGRQTRCEFRRLLHVAKRLNHPNR